MVKSSATEECYDEAGIILRIYESVPKIFPYNDEANRKWLEGMNIGVCTVYDIVYKGAVEEAVLAEWITPWKDQ